MNGRERREQLRERDQALGSSVRNGRAALRPAHPPGFQKRRRARADVPVRQVVHERGDPPSGGGRVVALEARRAPRARSRASCERIQRSSSGRSATGTSALRRGIEAVGVRVRDEERVDVPQGQQELLGPTSSRTSDRRHGASAQGEPLGEQVPAEGVGALAVRGRPRGRSRCRRSWTSSGLARRRCGRDRRRFDTSSNRNAAPLRPSACRTTRASDRSPRR